MEDKNGEAVLSREKARREEAWTLLEKAFNDQQRVTGVIFGRVKGGFTVDLSGAVAFLPGSQVDIRPVRDVGPLMGTPQPFQILKMDRRRGNIVVSRRAVLEESRAEARSELVANLKEGQVLDGVVKNITDYGAFVDLGGVDGLLHVTDIAWRRINHPSEALTIGQTVKVQVIRFNPETQRISLGMKQLETDPWEGAEAKYPVGAQAQGPRHQHHRLRRLRGAGAGRRGSGPRLRDELDQEERPPGQDRLDLAGSRSDGAGRRHVQAPHLARPQAVHGQSVGELRRAVPGRHRARRRGQQHHRVRPVRRPARRYRRHGPSVRPRWDKAGDEAIRDYKKGDKVKVKVLDVDIDKERISLGIKQLANDPFEKVGAVVKKGDVVTVTVAGIQDNGIDVTVAGRHPGLHPQVRAVARPFRAASRPLRGRRQARRQGHQHRQGLRRVVLSIKARELDEEKKAMAEFGSSDSGASLGDILGAALSRAQTDKEQSEE